MIVGLKGPLTGLTGLKGPLTGLTGLKGRETYRSDRLKGEGHLQV